MTKLARLSLIRQLWNARNLTCVVPASQSDIAEETSLIHEDDGKLIQEREISGPSSEMVAVSASVEIVDEKETDSILSKRERKQITIDLIAFRVRQDLSRPRNPFALVLVSGL